MDLVPPEGIKMVEIETVPNEVEPVVFNISVKVLAEDGKATVQLPPEVTPTERLVSYLHTVLKARELEIKHWTLDESQQKALESLSNVVVQSQTEETGD